MKKSRFTESQIFFKVVGGAVLFGRYTFALDELTYRGADGLGFLRNGEVDHGAPLLALVNDQPPMVAGAGAAIAAVEGAQPRHQLILLNIKFATLFVV